MVFAGFVRKKTVRSKLGRHIKKFCKERAKKTMKNLDLYVSLNLQNLLAKNKTS